MEYHQINFTGQEIDERLQNVGTPADKPDANGTLSARLNKNAADISALQTAVGDVKKDVEKNASAIGNADDLNDAKGSLYARVKRANASTDVNRLAITTLSSANKKNQAAIVDIDGRQTNIEKVVSGARKEAYFSLCFLDLIVDSEFLADIDNIKVVLYRWSGKRYAQFEMFTSNGIIGVSQETIGYEIILKQEQKDGTNVRTPYIHYNDDDTEEMLVDALTKAFGGRISNNRYKKRRWRIQAFLNNKPITAPFDFRVSIDISNNVSLTKEGMMRSVPATRQVKYDGYYDVDKWINCKVGKELDLSYRFFNEPLGAVSRKFPNPGDVMLRNASSHSVPRGVIISVFQDTPGSYCILWSDGMSIYEIGIDLDSNEYGGYNCYSPAKKLCDDIYDYASKMNSGTLRDLYVSAGAKYNETTGYYELNGLTDITEAEMRVIYKYAGTPQAKAAFAYSKARTNLPMPGMYNGTVYGAMFYGCPNLEVAYLGNRQSSQISYDVPLVYTEGNNCFYLCKKLKKIYGKIYQRNHWDLTFGYCLALEEVRIAELYSSIQLSWSPNLSKESVQYMITNAKPLSGAAVGSIAITLHPTAYARLKDDADIVAALEAKGGIVTLVSA